jgi:hypothetical protein
LYDWHFQYFCRQDSLETGQKAPVLLQQQQQQQLWQAVVVIVVRLVVAYVPEISMAICLSVSTIHSFYDLCAPDLLLLL